MFRGFARRTSEILGTAWSFVAALAIIVIWAATGHIFHYSDTWQLIINTGTTIVTFLMVFLIQNTQNRDSKAVGLKLDELIRAVGGARNHLVDLERLSDQELLQLQKEFERIGKKAEARKGERHRGQRRNCLTLSAAASSGRASPVRMKALAAWAKPENFALPAIRSSRKTAPPAVPDEPVTPVRPMLPRHILH